MRWISDLFEKHKLVRRALLVWICWLITVIVLWVLGNPAAVTDPVSRFFIAVVGLFTVVAGLYQYLRGREDK